MNIEGEKWTREWYLKHIIMGKAGLREGDVFNAKNLQRAMKEINRESYVQVQTEVERQEGGDENTQITLNVRDRFPVQMGVAYDDYGRSYTGDQRVSFLLGMHNLTGLGDKLYGGTVLASGSAGWMAGYSLPVSSYGTRLSFDFSDSHVHLHGPYRSLNVKGNAQSYFTKITHPLIQTAKSDLYLYSGYDYVKANPAEFESVDILIQMRYMEAVLTNRAGSAPNKKNDVKVIKETCLMPFTDIFIFPDGRMGICCCDNFEVTTLADLKTTPIAEAWNSDEYKKVREAIKDGRQNWPFCKFCDFIDAGLRMDAVNDVLAGREANHGARQSLMKHKK